MFDVGAVVLVLAKLPMRGIKCGVADVDVD